MVQIEKFSHHNSINKRGGSKRIWIAKEGIEADHMVEKFDLNSEIKGVRDPGMKKRKEILCMLRAKLRQQPFPRSRPKLSCPAKLNWDYIPPPHIDLHGAGR